MQIYAGSPPPFSRNGPPSACLRASASDAAAELYNILSTSSPQRRLSYIDERPSLPDRGQAPNFGSVGMGRHHINDRGVAGQGSPEVRIPSIAPTGRICEVLANPTDEKVLK